MLGVEGTRVVHVFNKMDLVTEPAVLRSMVAEQFERSAFVSAEMGEIEDLIGHLRTIRART